MQYRAWSAKEKKFLDNVALSPEGEINYKGEVIVQKCSEMRNRDGVLLFEGDVLTPIVKDKKLRQTVKFSSGCFYLGLDTLSRYLSWKVIGNVLENPSLKDKE